MLVLMELVKLTQEANSSVKSAYELLENRRGETHREFESHRTRQKAFGTQAPREFGLTLSQYSIPVLAYI